MTQDRGFSLVELMVSISLLAVLASIAVPGFQGLLQRNRVSADANLLLSHLQLARLRAITDGATVVICPSADGAHCIDDARAWAGGWLVFLDYDYRQPPQRDAGDNLLLIHRGNPASPALNTSLRHVRYSPSGHASNGTLVLCSGRNAAYARAVIINITGRARVATTMADGSPLHCL